MPSSFVSAHETIFVAKLKNSQCQLVPFSNNVRIGNKLSTGKDNRRYYVVEEFCTMAFDKL